MAALPAGLSEPRYSLEGGRHLAVFLGTSKSAGDDIYLAVSSTPASAPVSRATTVDGGSAALRVVDQEISGYRFRSLSLEWERRPGQWVTVTGLQGRADENVDRGVAASLIEAPQPIALQLRIAPGRLGPDQLQGRSKPGVRRRQLRDSEQTPSHGVPQERVRSPPSRKTHGSRPVTSTEADGRRALLVRGRETAEVQAELPDGSAVVLYGPSALFTDEQLLRMTAAVTLAGN